MSLRQDDRENLEDGYEEEEEGEYDEDIAVFDQEVSRALQGIAPDYERLKEWRDVADHQRKWDKYLVRKVDEISLRLSIEFSLERYFNTLRLFLFSYYQLGNAFQRKFSSLWKEKVFFPLFQQHSSITIDDLPLLSFCCFTLSTFSTRTLSSLSTIHHCWKFFLCSSCPELLGRAALLAGYKASTLVSLSESNYDDNVLEGVKENVRTAMSQLSAEYCTELSLYNCNLKFLSSHEVSRFLNLCSLHLSYNYLEENSLVWLGSLRKLEVLDLSFNHLQTIPPSIEFLVNLQHLDLSYNKMQLNTVNDVPLFLGTLNNLKWFDLRSNYGCLELISMHPFDVALFLKQRAQGRQAVYRERIMVVGREMAGKTSLVRRLMNPSTSVPWIPLDKRTFGVMTHTWKESDITISVKRYNHVEHHKLELEFWDFAGHTIFYPTHHLFLTSNVIYLLVFSWEWIDTIEVKGVASVLEEWIGRIRGRGIEEPILLVGTHMDCFGPRKIKYCLQQLGSLLAEQVRKRTVQEVDGRMVVVNVANNNSSEDGSGMKDLKKWIATLAERPGRGMRLGEEVPTTYLEVERKIKRHLNEVQMDEMEMEEASRSIAGFEPLGSRYSESCFMEFSEFRQAFAPLMSEEDVGAMLSFFHLTGLVLWRSPQLNRSQRLLSTQDEMEVDMECQEMVFLDPRWVMRELIPLINFLYDDKNKKHRSGILSTQELETHYNNLPPALRKRVPELLEWFQLAIRTTDDDWFIPLQLQPWSNKLDGEFLFDCPSNSRQFELEMSFLPDGLMAILFFQLYQMGPASCFRRDKCILHHKTERKRCWLELVSSRLKLRCSSFAIDFSHQVVQVIVGLIRERFSGVILSGIVHRRGEELLLEYSQLEEHENDSQPFIFDGEDIYYHQVLPQPSSSSSSSSTSCLVVGDDIWKEVVKGKVLAELLDQVALQWKYLGTLLGLSQTDIQEIEQQRGSRSIKEQTSGLLDELAKRKFGLKEFIDGLSLCSLKKTVMVLEKAFENY